ncbi:MAG: hypothetical protein HYZ50_08945 [Deltaproteobacteria bacterium]|nr:hypothetical protein [Deltaproteobacteria bacterium]
MKRGRRGSGIIGIIGGCTLLVCGGCTVQQQQQVLGTIGQVIPGASQSVFGESGPSSSESQAAAPAPRVDPNRVEAQLVLYTLQRAMSDNPSPFQECLDKAECKSALAAHLIRLQKQAMSTLDLPPAYDRYDLKRGKE